MSGMAQGKTISSPLAPRAGSLVLDLLSTLRRGSMPVRALVEAGGLFGIGSNSVRVALARLLARGLVERDERGLYRLGSAAGAIGRQVTSWRRLEEKTRLWDGGWIAAYGVPSQSSERGSGRRSGRALRFLGFRALAPGLSVRPDNLVGGVAGTRASLAGLGLGSGVLVAQIRELDPGMEARAQELWDSRALQTGYRDACQALGRSVERLSSLGAREAMVESFLWGGRVIRQLALDPLLPEEICPSAGRSALLEQMRRYDRIGRAAWAEFLDHYGVRHSRGAQDLRMTDAAATLSVAGGWS
ncbi:MAG TPA: PaaX family transcriptional regulator [Myxococcota bacterium]|nr:PaaX family transcriptional regulator [Myxococcota bacterium]